MSDKKAIMAVVCQVQHVGEAQLTCDHHEGGGKRCERLDPHEDGGHRWGAHTIRHEMLGNGYMCQGITGGDDMSVIGYLDEIEALVNGLRQVILERNNDV